MKSVKFKKYACLLLAALLLTVNFAILPVSADALPSTQNIINVDINNYDVSNMNVEGKQGYMGCTESVIITGNTGEISWQFDVLQEADYQLEIDYFPIESKNSSIVIGIKIDGEYIDKSLEEVTFKKLWKNEYDEKKYDSNGNEVLPKQIQTTSLISAYARKLTNTDNSIYNFKLSSGVHTVTFVAVKDTLALAGIRFSTPRKLPDYKTYRSNVPNTPCEENYKYYIQAEDTVYKSSSTMVPLNDRTSPLTSPNDAYNILYNSFGGAFSSGDFATWDFKVPKDGVYEIAIKYKQSSSTTILPTKRIYIDDEILFSEMEKVEFDYDKDWQCVRISVDGEAAGFYLTEGSHTLKIENTIGEFSTYIEKIENIVQELNAYYRKIIMITGTSPDSLRDYQLDVKLPDTIKGFASVSKELTQIMAELDRRKIGNGEMVELSTLKDQIADFIDEPESIPDRLESFKTNIGALSDWCIKMSSQSVIYDYFIICGNAVENDRAKANFFEKLIMEIKALIASFANDYNSISDSSEAEKKITVWMSSGRDQANIMKRIVDSDFKLKYDVSVDLKLVQNATILSALIAGKGPDVALELLAANPVDYAVRNALYDLKKFDDYDEVAKRFYESAVIPFSFNGGVYALPEKQSFPMLFYRTDVLEELGISIPETWDDVAVCLTELTNANMEFGVSCADADNTLATMAMFLYQNGGSLYVDNDKRSGLTTNEAMSAFKQLTDLYTSYKLPYAFNSLNRFRSGEMPMVIADYSLYNQLCISAPEINGLWGVSIVPGTAHADGTVDRSVAGTVTGCAIISTSKEKEAAWDFVKWWTSATTQADYGIQIESLLGQAARYPTANIEALAALPWSDKELAQLTQQQQHVKAVPQVPGSYFTSRHIYNAFRRVLTYGDDPRQTLIDYVSYIDEEIATKRDEFGLD